MPLSFGDCALDPARRELRRAGQAVHIEPQVFDLLLFLIENRERVVSKDDLLSSIWQGRIVSESSLSTRINAARTAIGDSGRRQQFVRTIPRKGFRFIGDVTGPIRPVDRSDVRPRIAVLPFTNISGDETQEYFADGLTEDVITDLAQISALFVTARNTVFAWKGKAGDVTEVARALNVGFILQGSVRTAADRVRITAQLVDGKTGGPLWAERYDRALDDIFALQDEISQSIVTALKLQLLPEEKASIARRPTRNAEAYQYYLMGRSYFLQSGLGLKVFRVARDLFAKAVAIDPTYAQAYAGVANCDSYLLCMGAQDISFEVILANCARALDLEPDLAEAHAARGLALYTAGRHKEADASLDRAVQLGSMSFEAHFFTGRNCRAQGRHAQAAVHFERAAELQPSDYRACGLAVDAYRSLGLRDKMLQAARRCLERAEAEVAVNTCNAGALAFGAGMLTLLNNPAASRAWADRAAALDPIDAIASYNLASAYVGQGRFELALMRLKEIFSGPPANRKCHVDWLKSDSSFHPLRGHPGFETLLRRLEREAMSDIPAVAE